MDNQFYISEKDELLGDNKDKGKKNKALELKELRNAGYIMLFTLFLCVPKIYLSNSIYYLSKDITTLQTQHDMLLDENKRLKHKIEDLRYKFLILNES